MAPLGTLARVLTAASLRLIIAVALWPSSSAMLWPAVLPPKLMGPELFKGMVV
jgi:hypothetical protein